MNEVMTRINTLMGIERDVTFSNFTIIDDPEISDAYKERLAMIRREIEEGKYTDYENTEELARDIGL